MGPTSNKSASERENTETVLSKKSYRNISPKTKGAKSQTERVLTELPDTSEFQINDN